MAESPVLRLAYSPEEAATALGVHRTSIYALMKTGALRSVKLGKSRRIPADALTELLGANAPDAA